MDNFTFCFVDLRGYGKSQKIQGECSLEEATRDTTHLVDTFKWDKFHLIGHSMTGMLIQNIAKEMWERVLSMIAITPTSAMGNPMPDDVIQFLKIAATDNDEAAINMMSFMTNGLYDQSFYAVKLKKWRQSSNPEARVAYLDMITQNDISHHVKGLKTPILVIAGEFDSEGYTKNVQELTFKKLYPNCTISEIPHCGHYPMNEQPVYLATLINKFLRDQTEKS
jgi:pimeloyl-ACP methyl ester carboxylesterase